MMIIRSKSLRTNTITTKCESNLFPPKKLVITLCLRCDICVVMSGSKHLSTFLSTCKVGRLCKSHCKLKIPTKVQFLETILFSVKTKNECFLKKKFKYYFFLVCLRGKVRSYYKNILFITHFSPYLHSVNLRLFIFSMLSF